MHEAAGLAKASQSAHERAKLPTAKHVPQRSQIRAAITPEDPKLGAQNPDRLAVDAFREIGDRRLDPRRFRIAGRIGWPLQGKNAHVAPLPLQLQNFIEDESFRETREHFQHIPDAGLGKALRHIATFYIETVVTRARPAAKSRIWLAAWRAPSKLRHALARSSISCRDNPTAAFTASRSVSALSFSGLI